MRGETLRFFMTDPSDVEYVHAVIRTDGDISNRKCTLFAEDSGGNLHSMTMGIHPEAHRLQIDRAHETITLVDHFGAQARLSPVEDGLKFELTFPGGVVPPKMLKKLREQPQLLASIS